MLIYKFGVNWLLKLLPPVVVGPIIIVIGLGIAPTAINMAMYKTVDGAKVYDLKILLSSSYHISSNNLLLCCFKRICETNSSIIRNCVWIYCRCICRIS